MTQKNAGPKRGPETKRSSKSAPLDQLQSRAQGEVEFARSVGLTVEQLKANEEQVESCLLFLHVARHGDPQILVQEKLRTPELMESVVRSQQQAIEQLSSAERGRGLELIATIDGLGLLAEAIDLNHMPHSDEPTEDELCSACRARIRQRYVEPGKVAEGTRIYFKSKKKERRPRFVRRAWKEASEAGIPMPAFVRLAMSRTGLSRRQIKRYLEE